MLVYENCAKNLDATLGILDAASNVQDVITITYNVIIVSNEYAKTIAAKDGGYSLRSDDGLYIEHSGTSNALLTRATDDFANTISYSGGFTIDCNSYHLTFNPSEGQVRFRYFSKWQYANALYKQQGSVINVSLGNNETESLSVGGTAHLTATKLKGATGTVGQAIQQTLRP